MKKATIYGLITLGAAAAATTLALKNQQTIPPGAEPVRDFDLQKYLGKWYEIARFRYFFERNLSDTTATYSLRGDGLLRVINAGYNYKSGQWDSVEGKAKFQGDSSVAALCVSFFGPFYSAYNVIGLTDDYRHALIAGKSTDYLWLLSRDKEMPTDIRDRFLTQARSLGYDTSRLIWPSHDRG
jgi:apolipoprotein D and lipocalin family protein